MRFSGGNVADIKVLATTGCIAAAWLLTFPAAPASRAYDEGPVDAFIDRAIDILLAVE